MTFNIMSANEKETQGQERVAKLEKTIRELRSEILERARSEEALRKSVERYRTLFNSIDEGFSLIEMILDDKGKPVDYRTLEANQPQEKITGFHDIVGKRARELIPNIEDNWIESLGKVALTGDSVRLEGWSEAVKKWFEVYASRIGDNESLEVAILFKDITELKKAEEEKKSLLNTVQAERDKLSALVNNIPDEVWFADTNKKLVLANPSALQEFSLTSKEINVEKMAEELEVYRPDGSPRPIDEAPALRALKGEVVRNLEEIVRTSASNELRYRQVNASPVRDTDGNIVGSVSVVRDITERKLTEEALEKAYNVLEEKVKERTAELERSYNLLKESKRSLAEAQKMAHVGSYDWDIITNEEYWSDELYRIFGLDPQPELNHNMFLKFIHPEDLDCLSHAINEALNGKPYHINYRIILPGGKERVIYSQGGVIFDEKNTPIRMRGIVQDITEHKKAEEKLRESEEKYRNIVETANEVILITDKENVITYVNKKITDMLGYTLEETVGRLIWDFISEEYKPVVKMNLEKRAQGISGSYELKLIRKDGSPLWTFLNAKPLFDKEGKYVGATSMLTDITERKKAEEALANIETARKKEIHHRIKNNLQVISSLLDLQSEQFKNRQNIKGSEVLEAFRESQNRVISMALIHEELYKGEEFETLNFSLYIKELAENLFNTYQLENIDLILNMDLEENLFFDMDTAVPLGIIVNELVSNSLKHAFPDREKGEIRIKLSRRENEKCIKDINEACKSTNLTLIVSDDGIGIPDSFDIENLDNLGLQLVTSLVDQLDGELELKRDKGTEFIIKFTVTEETNQASSKVIQTTI